jgi:hypothetical protein
MKTFKEFVSLCEEVEDKSKALCFQATIRRQNQGGRVGRDRRITDPERRRENPYKPRKDIGTQKQASTRVQQPEQERGSARETQLAAAKEERRKAAAARAAAKSGGETPKPKSSDLVKQATKILSKTKPAEVDKRPSDQPKRPAKRKVRVGPEYEGLTPREADKIYKRKIKSAGRKLLKSINPKIKDDEQSKKARS